MKQIKVKPIVTISTYEERVIENKRNSLNKDETDRILSNGNATSKLQLSKQSSLLTPSSPAPSTPIPDYDSTPTPPPPPPPTTPLTTTTTTTTALKHTKNCQYAAITVANKSTTAPTPTIANGSINKGTMGRCAASEIAKANGDTADMESIESFKLTNPSSPIPRPPSSYFCPQNSGPPTMKKKYRPVSVTIGEYPTQRKDPNKFDFIDNKMDNINLNNNHNNINNNYNNNNNNSDNNNNNNNNNNNTGTDVTDRLRNELEKTLSRSNLKKKNEQNGTTADSKIIDVNSKISTKMSPNHHHQHEINNHHNINITSKPILQKTQSNVEKIAAMLASQNLMGSRSNNITNNSNNNNNNNTENLNKVITVINTPKKLELRKTESTPINGILKTSPTTALPTTATSTLTNGHSSSEHKNITFGHVTTVIGER